VTSILLVPQLTELEWRIKPLLEEWAEVASYDAPGVGGEPPVEELTPLAIAERGLEELDRRGWDRYVLVADEFGGAAAAHLARARPEAIEAVALGHPVLSHDVEGDRAPLNRELMAALDQLARHDPRTYLHQMFKLTGGEEARGGYGADLIDTYMDRVSAELITFSLTLGPDSGKHIEESLSSLDVPMLLSQHKGCLLFTEEGYRDAVAALPNSRTQAVDEKPSASPEFAQALREFCEQHVAVG
jgi:pimeloyl-ACP methyl ester carboxylesterase